MKRAILCLLFLTACSRKPDLPVMFTVPEFTLVERSSREVNNQELAGQIWIADFIFTNCGGICPIMTGKMKQLQEKLPAEIRLVSFSVDPDVDTPAVLSEYAKKFGADPNRWLFLTGNRESLFTLSKDGFKLAVEADNGTKLEPITHSSRFVLVDRQGRIRGYYSMEDPSELERIISDAKSLL